MFKWLPYKRSYLHPVQGLAQALQLLLGSLYVQVRGGNCGVRDHLLSFVAAAVQLRIRREAVQLTRCR